MSSFLRKKLTLLLVAALIAGNLAFFNGANMAYAADYTYAVNTTLAPNTAPCVAGVCTYNNLAINNGVTVTVPSTITSIVVEGDATITGTLSANGQGSAGQSGTAPGTQAGTTGNGYRGGGGGGGYGGVGGNGAQCNTYGTKGIGGSPAYGSNTSPSTLGSGGGHSSYGVYGGAGGGLLNITVGGTITINGTIAANGNNGDSNGYSSGGGGAGGSIKIDANILSGSGSLIANGGTGGNGLAISGAFGGGGGGGAGGRIAVYYDSMSSFSITPTVSGGSGGSSAAECASNGSASVAGAIGSAILINQNNTPASSTDDDITIYGGFDFNNATFPATDTTYNSITIISASNLRSSTALTFTLNSDFITSGSGNSWSNSNQNVAISARDITLSALTYTSSSTTLNLTSSRDLALSNSSSIYDQTISIFSGEDLIIESGSYLSTNGRGSSGQSGTAPGTQAGTTGNGYRGGGGGGGYGGVGGNGTQCDTYGTKGIGGSPAYGSNTSPSALGSGGGHNAYGWGGSAGGGVINLTVSSTLTVDGTISANGSIGADNGASAGGGGAGGSIKIDANILSGSGSITANGGRGGNGADMGSYYGGGGGGGAGGRIAVYYDISNAITPTVSGGTGGASAAQCSGGSGSASVAGSAGTTYTLQYTVPSTPSITAPVNGTIDQSQTPTITSSAYSSNGRTHATSDWEVCVDDACSTVIWSAYDSPNKESIVVNDINGTFAGTHAGRATLMGGTTYYTRVLHTNSVGDSSYSTITSFATLNTAPTLTINSATQKTDGSGVVDIFVTVDDEDDQDTLKLKAEYKEGTDCSSGTSDPTLDEIDENTTATYGDPKIENDNEYQIGNAGGWATTSSGANTVLFNWDSATDAPAANGTYCLKITPHDGMVAGTAQTITLTMDNIDPTSLATLAVADTTQDTATLTWTSATEANFDHYEIWYGESQTDVQDREGTALKWDDSDDENLVNIETATTTISDLTINTTYYFKIWAVDTFGNEMTAADTSGTTNSPPIISGAGVTFATDGTGKAEITFILDDPDDNDSRAKLEYSVDGGDTWEDPTLDETDGNTTATNGDPKVENDNGYQIGNAGGWIGTLSGANTINLIWLTQEDINNEEYEDVRIRITPSDQAIDGVPVTSDPFILDNHAPEIDATAELSMQPESGNTFAKVAGSFIETHPGANEFYVAINDGEYEEVTIGDSDTATPSALDAMISSTLDGNDYISKIKIIHTDDYGNETVNENLSPDESLKYIKPYTPAIVTMSNIRKESVDIDINKNMNEITGLEYAIYEATTDRYVQASGELGGGAVWQNDGDWGVITVGGLTEVTNYSFQVKSRNPSDLEHQENSESDLSDAVSITTKESGGTGIVRNNIVHNYEEEESYVEEEEQENIKEEITLESFEDLSGVSATNWEYEVIKKVISNKLFTGEKNKKGETVFNPNNGMNRAMAATVVATYLGCAQQNFTTALFEDVPVNEWYAPSIACLKDKGVVSGKTANKFMPNDTITRAEFLKLFLGAYLDKNPLKKSILQVFLSSDYKFEKVFEDVGEKDWYYRHMNLAYKLGLLEGYVMNGMRYSGANTPIIRLEAAAIASNFLDLESE